MKRSQMKLVERIEITNNKIRDLTDKLKEYIVRLLDIESDEFKPRKKHKPKVK